ncbi:hypothetical protein TTHERM_01223610 (macronuclear) [Tetrahymena thermophila SB210]|uniref:Uncharacterized protein n=1 Tax=Tetrahymena thermophila (strain SB210) TaxID=312017 RepID=Q248J4_TETTS|nr:hypothetical protein TTHERM_01223610 [Tetrahymena thermophila SB210]EAS04191.2 hypothetical protein TTHERM_01223610 [Tetrahymena thermophila SB210]|eukprot:XP_001024436.2 hypothetical protein TTHERM_01223610 [Tetrahymena thermophila SB210]
MLIIKINALSVIWITSQIQNKMYAFTLNVITINFMTRINMMALKRAAVQPSVILLPSKMIRQTCAKPNQDVTLKDLHSKFCKKPSSQKTFLYINLIIMLPKKKDLSLFIIELMFLSQKACNSKPMIFSYFTQTIQFSQKELIIIYLYGILRMTQENQYNTKI